MKVTDDMNRLKPDLVQKAIDEALKPVKVELPDFPGQIAEINHKLNDVCRSLFDNTEIIEDITIPSYMKQIAALEKRIEKLEKKLAEKPADVNKDGKVDEKDLSIVHKGYAKAKKGKK